MKPPFTYYGGKTTVAPLIAALLPAHEHYVEPFAGSLAVLLAKTPSRMETVNDLDQSLMHFWRVLRDCPHELIRACALTPHSRAEYGADPEITSPVEAARLTWVRLTQGRAGSLREPKTGWRHFVNPRGSSVGMPAYLDGYVGRMAAVAERLHMVSLECMPALDLIAKYGVEAEALLYVDPPYLRSTRASGTDYRHEMHSDAEHRELAEALRAARATVVLSGYSSDLYEQLYPDWDRFEFRARTGNGKTPERVEVLWSNRRIAGDVQEDLFTTAGHDIPQAPQT